MIGQCQQGRSRRAWLRQLHRPAMLRFARRALRWTAQVIATAILVIAALFVMADLHRQPDAPRPSCTVSP
jgi:hypothetical protein